MEVIKTTRTYASRASALRALKKVADTDSVPWLIAVNEDGRFVPVIVGATHINFAIDHNITVVG